MTFYHCTLSCLFVSNVNWTYFWYLIGDNDGLYRAPASRLPDRAKEQGLYARLLPSFFYSPCSRSSSLAEIWSRYLNGPGYDNGLLSQTFYQLYMCYRDNSIIIRSSPSIIYRRKKYPREHLEIRRTNVGVWRRWKAMAKKPVIFCTNVLSISRSSLICCLKANSTLSQFSSIRFYLIIFLRIQQETKVVK